LDEAKARLFNVPGHPGGADGAGCGCVRLSWGAGAKAERGLETGRWTSNNEGQQESDGAGRTDAGGNRG
jgi:hypothetical protein